MKGSCLANYVGAFNARILEESGYRTKEDVLNAKVFDLMQIGSFAKEAHPRLVDRLEDLEDEDDEDEKLGIQKTVKIYGLKSDDRPNKKIKSLTVGDVIRFRPLTCERIQTLLDILENGMKRIKE